MSAERLRGLVILRDAPFKGYALPGFAAKPRCRSEHPLAPLNRAGIVLGKAAGAAVIALLEALTRLAVARPAAAGRGRRPA
jgi:hypothetical protein